MDARLQTLAKNIIRYSVSLQPGENILIESIGRNDDLVRALIKEAYDAKGIPFLKLGDNILQRELLLGALDSQMDVMMEADRLLMSRMQAYVGIRGGDNASELGDVPMPCLERYNKRYWHPVHSEIRVRKTKWVVLRYPTPGMSQLAGMSTEAFTDYYFRVCNLDYAHMARAMEPLKALMERTDKVRITGPGTDLSFSIKGIPAIPCCGQMNLPDGEIYTAPVKESVNGVIHYNTPALHQGFTYENVTLTFERGRIAHAEANDTERINAVFDTDEGARYVGEFALGVHPYIEKPMKDTLFDEKIFGSFHFTPGSSYDDAFNGNKSAVHWDLVCIQTPDYGGGEMYFDGVLIRKDGRFVLPELNGLNREALINA